MAGAEDDTWAGEEEAPRPPAPLLAERYRDGQLLAEGASGEVRRVWDTRLDAPVVMKVLAWDMLDRASVRARFWAEASVTARLQHPGIVPVHDRGELADGRLYFTMPEVRGRTLGVAFAELSVDDPVALRRAVR